MLYQEGCYDRFRCGIRKRDIYLNKLIAFQDTEPIKVVTGIRTAAKSSLLKLMAAHLRELVSMMNRSSR